MSVRHLGLVTGEAFASKISMTAVVIDPEDRDKFRSPHYFTDIKLETS